MNDMFWNLFVASGSIEAYLAYRNLWTGGADEGYEAYEKIEGTGGKYPAGAIEY